MGHQDAGRLFGRRGAWREAWREIPSAVLIAHPFVRKVDMLHLPRFDNTYTLARHAPLYFLPCHAKTTMTTAQQQARPRIR